MDQQLVEIEVRLEVLGRRVVEMEHLQQDAVGSLDHRVAQWAVGLDRPRLPTFVPQPFDRRFQVVDLHAKMVDWPALVRRLVVQVQSPTPDVEEDIAAACHRFIGHDLGTETISPERDGVIEVRCHQVRVVKSCPLFSHRTSLSQTVRQANLESLVLVADGSSGTQA